MKRLLLSSLFLFALFLPLASARAQQIALPDTTALDSSRIVTPGKAFYRSLIFPGWGQASVGAYFRGGVFFAMQGTSAFMVTRTIGRLNDAKAIKGRLERPVKDSLNALMASDTAAARRLSNPTAYDAAVDAGEGVHRARGLVNSRRQQRQDWITYLLVSTLASGVDAFVAAHLASFPATVSASPRASGGGFELQLQLRPR